MDDEEELWLEFDKHVGSLRLALGTVMQPLMMYGQQLYVGEAMKEIVSLAIQLNLKLSGLDAMPYHVNIDMLPGGER